MSQISREVLKAFKKLQRTRQFVFKDDNRALVEGRAMINEHFRKNQNETDPDEIKRMIKLAHDVDHELRTNVIQAVKKEEGVYELRITEDVTKLDNVVYNPAAVEAKPKRRAGGQQAGGCCGGAASVKKVFNTEHKKQLPEFE